MADKARRPERRRLSRAAFTAVLASAFCALSLVGVLHHEPWRDEYQAWMVAHDARSIPELFGNVKYEGNPALWHLILFAVTRLTDNPGAMAFVHIAISTLMIAIFARYTPLPPLPKVLFAFGYAPFFEFNLLSRGYASGLLFVMMFCALYPHRDRRLVLQALVLALMANNSPFGLMLSLLLGGHLILEQLVRRGRGVAWPPIAGAASVMVLGWAASVAQVYPEEDNSFPVLYAREGELWRIGFAVSRILVAYLTIPPLDQPHFWNHTIFDALPGWLQVVLAVALFAVFTLGFLRKRLLALLYVVGTVLLVAFVYQTRMAYLRYCLHIVILLVVCFSLERFFEADLEWPRLRALSDRVRPWSGRLFLLVLAGGAVGGIGTYAADLRRPFSTSGEAAAFLREAGLADLEIVGHTDFIVSPLAVHLDKKIFYPERQEYGRFIIWHRGRKPNAAFDEVAAAIERLLQQGHRSFLWIADSQPTFQENGRVQWYEGGSDLIPGANITLLAKIPPGIVRDEHYVIYRVDRLEPAPVK